MPDKRIKRTLSFDEIAGLRKQGKSCTAIAKLAGVQPTRIGQIIRELVSSGTITKEDEDMRIRRGGKLKEFTGTELDVEVKDALRRYVVGRTSISKFLAEAVLEKMDDLGIEIIRVPINTGEPLPFDEGDDSGRDSSAKGSAGIRLDGPSEATRDSE